MATRSIVPRGTGEGSIGTPAKRWGKIYANEIDKGAQINGAFNKKAAYTSSGSFTAPVTGIYRITLVGGGGGGSGAGTLTSVHFSGAGGGQGGVFEFYENLTAGTSYSYTIGAGGSGGAAGSATNSTGSAGAIGGDSSITIGNNVYKAGGGYFGGGAATGFVGGVGGTNLLNNQGVTPPSCSLCGGNGMYGTTDALPGVGGGAGNRPYAYSGALGSGGAGGIMSLYNGTVIFGNGMAGANGYITFEYYDPNA